MPIRMIRDGWLESERLATLDAECERFFLRVCLRADDFGRFHANPALLRSSLFPLRDDIKTSHIPAWLAACEKVGLVRCYEADGKRFLEIPKFGQRLRAAVSKFPPPADNCPQLAVNCLSHVRNPPPELETEVEVETEGEEKKKGVPPLPFASPEFASLWADFVRHRIEIRKPLKPTATKAMLASLVVWGETRAVAAIRHTLAKGWQGIREPDAPNGNIPGANRHQMPAATKADYEAAGPNGGWGPNEGESP